MRVEISVESVDGVRVAARPAPRSSRPPPSIWVI